MAEIIWTRLALKDLHTIFKFISEDSSFYANRFINVLVEKVEVLRDYPLAG